jgi:hypothetical protein
MLTMRFYTEILLNLGFCWLKQLKLGLIFEDFHIMVSGLAAGAL